MASTGLFALLEWNQRQKGRDIMETMLGSPAEIDHSRRSPHVDDAHIRTPGTGLLGGEMTDADFLRRATVVPGYKRYGMEAVQNMALQQMRNDAAMERYMHDFNNLDALEQQQLLTAQAQQRNHNQTFDYNAAKQGWAEEKHGWEQEVQPFKQMKAESDALAAGSAYLSSEQDRAQKTRELQNVDALMREYGGARPELLQGLQPQQIFQEWGDLYDKYSPIMGELDTAQQAVDASKAILKSAGDYRNLTGADQLTLTKYLTKLTTPLESVMAGDVDAVGLETASLTDRARAAMKAIKSDARMSPDQVKSVLELMGDISGAYTQYQGRKRRRLEQAHGGAWNTSRLIGEDFRPFTWSGTGNVKPGDDEQESTSDDSGVLSDWYPSE